MIRVKICGIRNKEEAMAAVDSGCDGVGLILGIRHFSEDALDESDAANILKELPPFVSTVLVTHLIDAGSVIRLHQAVSTTTIQLHDVITVSEVRKVKEALPHVKLIKGIQVTDETSLVEARRYEELVDAVLLDSSTPNRIGGTGHIHDWSISRSIVRAVRKPVVLAGGLTPGNVSEAIKTVGPFGVDVNSGVEFLDGSKDPEKIKEFVKLAKSMN